MKELSLAVEKLTQQVASKKDELESEITDTQAAQIQLDRAAQDFRQLHQERQDLIRQWDEAREAMKHRDEAIQVGSAATTLTHSLGLHRPRCEHMAAEAPACM